MHSNEPQTTKGNWIGEAAQRSGVTTAGIRHYEQAGLIRRPTGSEAGYRWYTEADIHQLRFIRQLRNLDMGLPEVKAMLQLDLSRKPDCQLARSQLDTHLARVAQKIEALQQLQSKLTVLRGHCNGTAPTCKLLANLHAQADAQRSGQST